VEERSKWQLVGWAVAAALLVIAAVRVFDPDAGGETPSAAPPVRVEGGAGAGSTGGRDGSALYVHVAGAVRRPGLYRVPGGSRVAAAIVRAGGPLRRAEMTAVNLAQQIEDGQQVIVPAAVSGAPGAVAGGAAVPGGAGVEIPISLATATQEQLEEVDGIGPVLAGAIIEYRDANGGFRSIEELQEVDGIGEKRFATLEEAVRP
jgi:competence protein ComEA